MQERIKKKLQGWKEKTLSQAGREVLIKSVAQAIPTYLISCLKLTKKLCDEINAVVRDFWLGQKRCEKKISWVSWETLCKKKDEGGMGFRDLEAFNQASLAKQGWRIIMQPHSLSSKTLKAKYFPHSDFGMLNWDPIPHSYRGVY